jgi:hypothetical protein
MYSRWYSLAVVFLWLLAMSWLVIGKLVPDWTIGEPPDYGRVIEAQKREGVVGWRMACNDEPLGWALSQTVALPNDLAEIESHVHFADLRTLSRKSLLGGALRQLIPGDEAVSVDARTLVRIDSLDKLLDFDTSLWQGNERLIRLRGRVDGGKLHLTFSAGSYFKPVEHSISLPPGALMSDAFSPQSQLPELRVGQTWTVPVANPLLPTQPMEILHAEVIASEPYVWGDETVQVWLVEYRSEPGYAAATDRAPRGRLWVARDGTVLKQEASLLDATLSFTRMSAAETKQMEESVDPKWSQSR